MHTSAGRSKYLSLELRAHELLRDVPLYDVWVLDLPGGGAGRSLADIRELEKTARPSSVMVALFGVRRLLGRVFGWDKVPVKPADTLLSRLSEQDRRASEVAPGTPVGPFLVLYQFPNESLRETRNATVRGWISLALEPTATGYRFFFAVYVLPVSWVTRPYLIAIEPFRLLLYPAMLNRIRRAWITAYGGA
jgi:Protein of unknown function (DUF2867)